MIDSTLYTSSTNGAISVSKQTFHKLNSSISCIPCHTKLNFSSTAPDYILVVFYFQESDFATTLHPGAILLHSCYTVVCSSLTDNIVVSEKNCVIITPFWFQFESDRHRFPCTDLCTLMNLQSQLHATKG